MKHSDESIPKIEPYPVVFLDGEIVPADQARISVHANALSYGTGTFEGIRAFCGARQELRLLAARQHLERLHRSVRILGLTLHLSVEELIVACIDLLQLNEVAADAYLRPLVVLSTETLHVRTHGLHSRLSIAVTPMDLRYINPNGVRCMVSSWRRCPDVAMPSRAKTTGGYLGPAMAKTEAIRCGFDEAIMLNMDGHVAEASTSNIFLRFGNVWVTPPPQDDILEGITRAELLVLISELFSETVIERSVDRSELYACDEVLLCGTAALVVPVLSIDNRSVGTGAAGQRTLDLQRVLLAIGRGDDIRHEEWITPARRTSSAHAHARSFHETAQ